MKVTQTAPDQITIKLSFAEARELAQDLNASLLPVVGGGLADELETILEPPA